MPPSIAIIGAGIAGLACADALRAQGWQPAIFEKSRGIGGRAATRQSRRGWQFDHGAQYVTAHGDAFRRYLETALAGGAAASWSPLRATGVPSGGPPWYVGAPAMNALAAPLAAGLDIRFDTEIVAVEQTPAGWRLHTGDGDVATVDRIVCTAPAPQTRQLLQPHGAFDDALAAVDIAPCWAVMAAFEAPVDAGFEAWRGEDAVLAWIARDDAKPGRSRNANSWIIHAGPAWSRANLEADREAVAAQLIGEFGRVVGGPLPGIAYIEAHRWRYAMTQTPLGAPFLVSADGTLMAGGDWCLGARVEFAFGSGRAIAAALRAGEGA